MFVGCVLVLRWLHAAVCTTVPHHCDDVFVCRVWVHVSPPPPPPPPLAALQPDICSGCSPALCSRLSLTQCNECGEPGAGAAGAGWAVFWAGCCRSCSISMHAPPTSAPPPTVTPHLDTCISTLALDIYTRYKTPNTRLLLAAALRMPTLQHISAAAAWALPACRRVMQTVY